MEGGKKEGKEEGRKESRMDRIIGLQTTLEVVRSRTWIGLRKISHESK